MLVCKKIFILLYSTRSPVYSRLPHRLALLNGVFQTTVGGLVRIADGDLLEVLQTVFHLHHFSLVAEVLLVSDENAVRIVALVVGLENKHS